MALKHEGYLTISTGDDPKLIIFDEDDSPEAVKRSADLCMREYGGSHVLEVPGYPDWFLYGDGASILATLCITSYTD